jgi:hypothetical protein
MNWHEVSDYQAELLNLLRSDLGKRYVFGWCWETSHGDEYPMDMAEHAAGMYRTLRESVARAEPVAVEEEVLDLVEAAADGFEPEPLHGHDLITPAGFVVFPRPIIRYDVHGRECAVRALGWGPAMFNDPELDKGSATPGIQLALFSHRDDEDWYTAHHGKAPMLGPSKLGLFHLYPWRFGEAWGELEVKVEQDGVPVSVFSGYSRFCQAFWRICLGRVTVMEHRRPPRPVRRRAERLELMGETQVIRLRRPASRPQREEGEGVAWTCRWLVHGHWRQQWYPSLDAHRQIYIDPYVKGPDDKELRIRDRAFELVR